MSKIVVTVDSGADLRPELADELGIKVIPFHLALGDVTFDDGEIATEDMLKICAEEKTLPTTSACTPMDYEKVFQEVLGEEDTEILHLALSSDLTRSFHSALDASETEPRVTCLDSETIAGAYGIIAERLAKFVKDKHDMTMAKVLEYAHSLIKRVRLAFVPYDLTFLKAGGRLSNTSFMAAQVLNIRPVIEIEEGKLVVKKKLHGSLRKIVGHMLDDLFSREQLDLDEVIYLFNTELPERVKEFANKKAEEFGFKKIRWEQAGCVISAHCGPDAFGCVVLAAE